MLITAARRSGAVAALFLALIVATSVPASAAFSAADAVSTTVTVAAPSSVTVNGRCTGVNYNATIRWQASTSSNVTGYRVVANLNNGTTSLLGTTDAATLSLAVSSSSANLSFYQPTVTVTTLTSYGWTGDSLPSAVLTC